MEQNTTAILQGLLRLPENRSCADCGEKNPRWVSTNLGCFLCLICAGIHRKMGTDVSRIKSVTLDTWTPEQVEAVRSKGNTYTNNLYDPYPERHSPCPKGDEASLEQWIRDKYERKKFMRLGEPTGPAIRSQGSQSQLSSDSQVYAALLHSLVSMGFKDERRNIEALRAAKGEIEVAVKILLNDAQQTQGKAQQAAPRPAQPTSQPASQPRTQQPQPTQQARSNDADLLGIFGAAPSAPTGQQAPIPIQYQSQSQSQSQEFGTFASASPSYPPSYGNAAYSMPALAPAPSSTTVNANILSLYSNSPPASGYPQPGYSQPRGPYGNQPGYGYGYSAQPSPVYGARPGYGVQQPNYGVQPGYRPQPGFGYQASPF